VKKFYIFRIFENFFGVDNDGSLGPVTDVVTAGALGEGRKSLFS